LVNEHDARQQAEREAAAAEAFDLPKPARRQERRRVKLAATLVVLVLAVLGVASYKFAANAGHDRRAAAAGHPRATATAVPSAASSVLPGPASASTAPASTASASPGLASTAPASPPPASTAPAPPSRVLTVASVAAFGPGGLADGQNPQHTALAVSGNAATPWLSDWYVSPDFYDLPAGTGLLLDMGRTVTVTSVRVSLNSHGADLQLRAGSKPLPSWLPVVASTSNVGGTVQLHPGAPLHVRYVLVWFTQLPPDGSGTYQASVYQVIVKGQP
jgi:hypothetical protein